MAEPRPVTVKGVCLDGAGRVLVCRNARGEWELPGGRAEAAEGLAQCLEREVREETGLEVAVRERVAAYPFEVVPGRWVDVIVFGCALHGTARSPQVSHEHVAVRFASVDELGDELPRGYRAAIESWRAAGRG